MTLTEQFCCHSTNGTFSQQEIFFVALIIASAAAAIEDLNQEVKWDPAGRVKKNFKTFFSFMRLLTKPRIPHCLCN